jgi:hypothetical protein
VRFVVEKVALEQVFSEYLISLANSHSTDFSTIIIIYYPGVVEQAGSGRSTKWSRSHPMRKINIKYK